jgi:hypothetical protein
MSHKSVSSTIERVKGRLVALFAARPGIAIVAISKHPQSSLWASLLPKQQSLAIA